MSEGANALAEPLGQPFTEPANMPLTK
jgi:hypothetical protein